MRSTSLLRGLLGGLLVLSACSQPEADAPAAPPPAPEPMALNYVCAGGVGAGARHGADGALTLTYGETAYPMNPAEAVSGSRWVGEDLEWWVTLEGADEVGTLRRLGDARVGESVVARCVRPSTGGLLAPDPEPSTPETPTATPVAGEPCRSPALSLEVVSTEAGAGQRYAVLAFTNEGSVACTVQGYPGLALVGGDGRVRPDITVDRTPGPYYEQGQPIAAVSLEPRGRAYFDLISTAVAGEIDGETEPCAPVIAVRASPPNDPGSVQAPLSLNPCNGRVRITPFRPVQEPNRPG